MSVRFILGRAGTGKTHHCLSAIRQRLRNDPVDGPRLVFLVPEQAGQQMERALFTASTSDMPQVEAAHRAEVVSFQRLAFRVIESVGGSQRIALSECARAMVIRHLLSANAARLRYYRRPERLTGLVDRLAASLTEFMQEGIVAEEVAVACRETDIAAAAHAAKLHDLALIHAAYQDYLKQGYADPSQYLQLAREQAPRCRWLVGAELWVDGFASLSGEEIRTLIAVARLASRTEITVLMDPALAPSGQPSGWATQALFERTSDMYRELHEVFLGEGLAVEEPLLLRCERPPRFAGIPSLADVERRWGSTPPVDPAAPPAVGVELVELPSRRVEVEYAVSRICRWVQESGSGYRYRDVAIIARDLELYHELLAASLQSRGVPFFMDQRRGVAHHPLIELLRGLVAIAAECFSLSSVCLLLKTGLLPISDEQGDELENYLLAFGIAGADAWYGPDWQFMRSEGRNDTASPKPHAVARLARVNAARRRVAQTLNDWWTFSQPRRPRAGAQWAQSLRGVLGQLRTAEVLAARARAAEFDGRPDEADEHRRLWAEVLSFLDDLEHAFRQPVLTLSDLADVVESGLSSLTLGLAPPTIDQVLVGAIERSRHPDIKAVVLIGFNDGLFPQRPAEDSILNDDDRRLLRGAGLRVAPPARQRGFDETMLAYIALTRASDALVVTFAASDDRGKMLAPSPYVAALMAACPGLSVKSAADPTRDRTTWDILASCDLRRRVALEFRSRPPRETDTQESRGRWNELYDATRLGMSNDSVTRTVFRALDERRPTKLAATSLGQVFADPLRTSVSQLETYAACPFKFFAEHVLRLRQRDGARLQPFDIGRVYHRVLEDFVRRTVERRVSLARLSDEDLLSSLTESCRRVGDAMPPDASAMEARNAYVLRRSTRDLRRVLEAQRRVAQGGKAGTIAAELAFGFDEPGSLPPLAILTPGGHRAMLRGYIDRVDLAMLDEALGVVIDYKRTRRKILGLTDVYHGLALQLLAYLLVLAENTQGITGQSVEPIAALFVSLASQYVRVPHPRDDSRDAALGGMFRPRGLIRADRVDALAASGGTGWLADYSMYRNKDGRIGRVDSTDAASPEDFSRLLDHTRNKLAQLVDGVLEGNVGVSPYRLKDFRPCQYCEMKAACGFDFAQDRVRELERMRRSEVFARLAQADEWRTNADGFPPYLASTSPPASRQAEKPPRRA